MKTILKKITANSLSLDNNHLLDVLNNDKYIEMGNINYKTFSRLLAGKLIKLEDLSFFPIQNIGLGGSRLDNNQESCENSEARDLINKLPFIALKNNINNHSSRIVVITYGLLIQIANTKDFSSREEFTPMILIPVEMFIDNEDISFQIISQPFVNPNINSIKNINARTSNNDVVNNIYNIDKFCLSYNNLQNVRLESYVSYINLKGANTKFTTKFFNESLNLYGIDNHYNIDKTSQINITPLNKYQRNAIEKAHEGHSFEIVGAIGTGKTTALVNIAMDAFYNDKKVLYISSRIESLKEAYKILEDNDLNGVAARFYLPFKNLREKYNRQVKSISSKELFNENLEIRKSLKELYVKSEKFIGYLYKRINNFYVIDVLNRCIKYRDLKTSFPEGTLDGISKIYHEELHQVTDSLSDIDENKKKIASIKDSIYSPIPTSIRITVEEIMDLLVGLRDQYLRLDKYKKDLVKTYGFKAMENYAYLRSCLNNYRLVDKELIPDVWLKYDENGLYDFNKAKTVFLNFRNEMEELEAQRKEIEDNYYTDLAYSLDLEKDTEYLYMRFKANKVELINSFLFENNKLIEILDDFIDTISENEASFDKMSKAIKCKINFGDDQLVRHIMSFMKYIHENKYSKEWLKLENKKLVASKIEESRSILAQYEEDKRALGISDTKHLSEYVDNLKIKKIFRGRDKKFKENFAKANELLRTSKVIDTVYTDYLKYTGDNYSNEVNGLNKFTEFVKCLEAIEDLSVRKGIIQMLDLLDYEDVLDEISPFITFGEYYTSLDNKHELLCNFGLVNPKSSYKNRIKDILETFEYCKNIKRIQENVYNSMRIKGEYVSIEDINILKNRIDKQHRIENSIDHNPEYKRLLTSLYVGYKSDVNQIDKLINNFQMYQNNFKEWKYVALSFDNKKKLDGIVEECYTLCQEVVEGIKNYTKIFKTSTDDFYYNSFDDIFDLFKKMIDGKDELEVYLNIAKDLDDLEKIGLYKLYDFIFNKFDKDIDYCNTFLKEYYANVLKMFEDKNKEVLNIDDNYRLLDEIIAKENEFIDSNVKILQNKEKNKFNIYSLRNMDYNDYVSKTTGTKWLFFATPTILNYFIDPSLFDLILVDDAQLLDSNEYIKVVGAKQLIVSGIPQVSFGVTDDLLSIMKRTAIIKMKHKYELTPINLLNNFERIKGMFPVLYDKNNGISQTKLSIPKIIEEIIKEDNANLKEIKVNIFMEDDDKIRLLYDDITQVMIDNNIDSETIYKFVNENLNICSLNRHYAISADYNILNIYDYKDMNDHYETINFINMISNVKNKTIICDAQSVLQIIEKKTFLASVDKLLGSKIEFKKNYPDDSIQKLIKRLREKRIEVMGSIGNYGLVLRNRNVLSGVIFFDIESLHESSAMNLYRNLIYGSGIDCIPIFLFDLEKNFDACVDKVIKMTINAKVKIDEITSIERKDENHIEEKTEEASV